jgi:VIT1/CCC1 family predicted Fe2+/Mn2+ transporter
VIQLPSIRRPFTVSAAPRVEDASRDAAELTERVAIVSRGGARAAVLGVNDGLVTNLCLILAVAGASIGASEIRVAGLASLIAGAFSMAAGEWISVKSQVELYEGIVDEIRILAERNPRLILDQLTASLRDTGFANDTSQRVATELPLDDERFVSFSARTVFGFDTEQLGSPVTAAVSSLGLFAIGALIPLAPWFITSGTPAIFASIVATALASVAVGGWVSHSSGRSVVQGALRQLAIVIVVATVTYAIGKVFGTAVA